MSLAHPPPMSRAPSPFAVWWGGLTSMLFWMVLLLAGAVYAGVALAPKVLHWHRWQDLYVAQRYQLVEREQQVEALERMVDALDQDPQFLRELARLDLDATDTGAESIPVDDGLTHDPRQLSTPSPSHAAPFSAGPPWEPWLLVLATNEPLRRSLLAAAAILVITAFTFLHDGSETLRAIHDQDYDHGLTVWQMWSRRYRLPPEDQRAA